MKKAKLIGGVCLALVLVVTLCAVPVFADEENESGPLPPSIMPVVVLQGSDHEMGYQYYQQLAQVLGPWVLERVVHDEFTDEEIKALKAYQWYIKEYAPEQIEEMKGMADGATDAGVPLSYTEVLAKYTGTKSYPGTEPPGSGADLLPPWCSAFAAWGSATKDGSLIAAHSNDGTFSYQVAVIAFPDNGNSYISVAGAGHLTNDPCMNNKGIFIGGHGGFGRRSIDYGYGIPPWSCAVQHVIRFADSASEAKDMLLSWEIAGSKNYTIADINGNAFVVEKSAAFQSVREPGQYTTGEEEYGKDTNFIYCANNYFTDEGGEAILGEKFIEHAGWLGRSASISSVPRNKELWTMLDRYRGEMDLDFAKMMWRMPGEGCPVTCDAACKEAYYATQGEGWDQKICNLDNANVVITQPDDGDKGVLYISTGPAAKVAYPLVPGGHYYQIEGTHTFYQLALAASPAAVVSAAKTASHNYIAKAYHQLMWLNYTDTGYAALNELYSTANAEYYEGINWTNKAKLASGNDALLYYAKAATAFTRAQAHAQQVYNALVPPATCPKDLGLKPYKETAWPGDKGKAKGKDKD